MDSEAQGHVCLEAALISVPIAVTSMGHCGNAEVQLQLVKFDGLELLDKQT